MKPHKHAEIIKAWADGAEIEFWNNYCERWELCDPLWDDHNKYRIKPKEKVVRWLWAWRDPASGDWFQAGKYMTEDESKTYFYGMGNVLRALANTRQEFDE